MRVSCGRHNPRAVNEGQGKAGVGRKCKEMFAGYFSVSCEQTQLVFWEVYLLGHEAVLGGSYGEIMPSNSSSEGGESR